MPWDALNAAESKVGVHTWSADGLVWCWRLLRVLKWHSQWRQISSWILSQILMLMPSSPPPLCKCLTFFFLVPFSHLARSKCCKLALLVKMCFLHLLSLSPSYFSSTCFYQLSSSLLLWSIAPYILMLSSLLSFSLSAPHPSRATRLLSLFLSPSLRLWLAGWFILLSALHRYTLGRALLLWTGYVWAYLLQRWAKCCSITQAPFSSL